MIEADLAETLQIRRERLELVGQEVQPEDLDRDQAVPGLVVRAEDRAEKTGTDLVENPKRPERGRRRVRGEVVVRQRLTPQASIGC